MKKHKHEERNPISFLRAHIHKLLCKLRQLCDQYNSILTLVISIAALITSFAAIHISLDQGDQETQRWLKEGARYELSYAVAPAADEGVDLFDDTRFKQLNGSLIITNTGRTQGTVIEIRATESDYDEELIMCVPTIEDGGKINLSSDNTELPYMDGTSYSYDSQANKEASATIGAKEITLEPGESRLLFLAGEAHEEGQGTPEAYDGAYDVYTAGGEKYTLQPVDHGDTYSTHYQNLPGFDTARRMCSQFARERLGENGSE